MKSVKNFYKTNVSCIISNYNLFLLYKITAIYEMKSEAQKNYKLNCVFLSSNWI